MAQLFKIPDGKLQDMHGTQISVGVGSVTAGTGITLTGTASDPIINNSGVLSVSAGTGITATGTASAPIINNAGVLSLTAGTAITLSGTASAPVVNNNGVTSLAGTANQITASAGTGAVTLSVPSVFVGPGSVSATTDLTGAGLIITGQADFQGSGPVMILDNAGAGINFVRTGLTGVRFATNVAGTQLTPVTGNWSGSGTGIVTLASAGDSNIGYVRITCTDSNKVVGSLLIITIPTTNSSTASTVVQATVVYSSGTEQFALMQAGMNVSNNIEIILQVMLNDFTTGKFVDLWWRKYELVDA